MTEPKQKVTGKVWARVSPSFWECAEILRILDFSWLFKLEA